jgi:hypothetical protein
VRGFWSFALVIAVGLNGMIDQMQHIVRKTSVRGEVGAYNTILDELWMEEDESFINEKHV